MISEPIKMNDYSGFYQCCIVDWGDVATYMDWPYDWVSQYLPLRTSRIFWNWYFHSTLFFGREISLL